MQAIPCHEQCCTLLILHLLVDMQVYRGGVGSGSQCVADSGQAHLICSYPEGMGAAA